MSEHDDRVSAAYRGLPRAEPSASLDDAILAASRRAAAPVRRMRDWGVPVSIAAVVMLAAGLTFHMRDEQPGIETQEPGARNAPAPAAPAEPTPQPQPQAAPEPAVSTAQQPPPPAVEKRRATRATPELQKNAPATPAPFPTEAARKDAAPAVEEPGAAARFAPPVAAPAAPPPPAASNITAPMRAETAPMPAIRAKREAAASAPSGATAGMAADSASKQSGVAREQEQADTPERELERIARLRSEGKDTEADKALEEFHRRHPDYRIAPAMWDRVKPR